MKYHKLLERQIRKYLQEGETKVDPRLASLLGAISQAYDSYDEDRELSQRAFDLSDKEYQGITEKLTKEIEQREQSINTLLRAISEIEQQSGNSFEYDRTDLLTVTKYLQRQVQMRIQTEDELKVSEQNFRQINETIEDVFWLYDHHAREYLYISPSCEKLFGAKQHHFIDGSVEVNALVDPQDVSVFENIWSTLDEDQSYSIEYRINLNGQIKWIHERSFAIRDEEGELVRQSGVYVDITERKLNEEATKTYLKEINELKKSLEIREEQYRGLVENASDIIYELDGTGKPTYINQMSESVIGYTNEELYTRHFWEIIPKGYAKAFTAKYLDLIKRKAKYSYLEVPIQKKSGEVIWLGQNTTMFFKGDWLYKAHVIARDITVQKKSEDEIQQLSEFQKKILDGTDYGFITTSHPEGLITTFNKGAEEMLGYSAEEVIGKKTPAIFHEHAEVESRAQELSKELDIHVSAGVDVFHIKVREGLLSVDVNEWTYIHKTGKRITVELSITALKDKNDSITGYLGIAKDITQRKKAELDIIKAKEQAEVASQAKSEFLANMSHEIRTPLNGVMGFTDLLIKTKIDETQAKYLSMVSHSANVLLDIINDVLDFAKIEAGKLELDITNTNIHELCHSVVRMTSPQIEEKKLMHYCTLDEKVPGLVLADELRLRQVLVNLIANAVKFTNTGEVELSVQFLGYDEEGRCQLRFSIRDTGVGINPADQQKIFDAFAQVDTSTTKKFGGTGLGLTISNNLLALMDSQIYLESESGVGSLFYFDVSFTPVVENPPKTEELLGSSNDADTIEGKERSNLALFEGREFSVLIAEDNPVNMQVIKYILEKIVPQAHLIEATDGLDAVSKFRQKVPSVVFMDVQMPEMNGYEATQEIRKIEASLNVNGSPAIHTPIVALTAGIIKGEREKCLEAGMDDYVSKPIVIDTIRTVLSQWLN